MALRDDGAFYEFLASNTGIDRDLADRVWAYCQKVGRAPWASPSRPDLSVSELTRPESELRFAVVPGTTVVVRWEQFYETGDVDLFSVDWASDWDLLN